MEGLTVGRVVHYVIASGVHCAALIVSIGNDASLGECELQVAIPSFGWQTVLQAYFNPHQKPIGTWHWIEPA